MNFKITQAEMKGEEVIVSASFLNEAGKAVKKIIHAFPRSFTAKQIRGEVGKAMKLYESELEQSLKQKEVDRKIEQDKKLINDLIDK